MWPPVKYHLIIHHHLCHESQIAAADLSENSSKKYQSHFGSCRQRTVPRRLCGHASTLPERAVRAFFRQTTERKQVLRGCNGGTRSCFQRLLYNKDVIHSNMAPCDRTWAIKKYCNLFVCGLLCKDCAHFVGSRTAWFPYSGCGFPTAGCADPGAVSSENLSYLWQSLACSK